MEVFDLGLAYVWEYDDGFLELIERTLQNTGFSTFILSYHNIHEVRDRIINRKLAFNFYIDRAWDVDDDFETLGQIINRRKTIIFNPYKKVLHAIDKASMHLEFLTAGLNVPYSIIIPPHSEIENIAITIEELEILGRPFIIKPCNTTGGGIGVVTGAESLREVLDERLTNTDDKYILQEKIYPKMLNGKRAWFRAFWAFGGPIPVWWDDQTHLYEELKPEEIENYGLRKLFGITRKIAKITGLDFFSTEIVYTNDDKFVVIDYVNDQCDMRLKSKHIDGVPDSVGYQIVNNLQKTIIREKKKIKN
jgi:hypothetical protein